MAEDKEAETVTDDIHDIENKLESVVQRVMDSFDAWRFSRVLEGKKPDDAPDPNKCSRENRKCKIMTDEPGKLCTGCSLYRRIVREHGIFPVGGHSGVCDTFVAYVAEPLIHFFMTNAQWLEHTNKLTDKWFIRCPITFSARPRNTLHPMIENAVRRNYVRLYRVSDVLKDIGLVDRMDNILGALNLHYNTPAGGAIYFYDEFMDYIAPFRAITESLHNIGAGDTVDIPHMIAGLARRAHVEDE